MHKIIVRNYWGVDFEPLEMEHATIRQSGNRILIYNDKVVYHYYMSTGNPMEIWLCTDGTVMVDCPESKINRVEKVFRYLNQE